MNHAAELELAEADASVDRSDWEAVERHARAALAHDPDSEDASSLLALARRRLKSAPQLAPTGERRTLTVMFCDLVGSTELADNADPEDTRAVLQWYHSLIAEVIERHGGFVSRYMGDGALIYFGWPVAVDDSALNAVRASLALRAAVAEQDPQRTAKFGRLPEVRIGIHTGLVVIGTMGAGKRVEHDDVVGDTPNIAARLEGLAMPGTVVVSNDTWRLVERSVTGGFLGSHKLKGIAEPMDVYRVDEVTDRPTRFSLAVHSGAFAGRETELDTLRCRFAQVREGHGSMIGVRGDAGLGKSRLIEHFLQECDVPVTRIQCDALYASSSFYPLSRVFGQIKAGQLAPAPPISNLSQTADDTRERLIVSAIGQIKSTAKDGPAIVCIEDVHWVDPSTHEVLKRLGPAVESARLMVIVSYRPLFDDADLPLVGRIDVGPLDWESFGALVESLTAGQSLRPGLSEQLYERTGGVPLFAEEMINSLLEVGSFDALTAIPTSLNDVLTGRLDRCGRAKSTAQLASVLGRTAAVDLLVRIAGVDDLEDDLDVLERAGVISWVTDGLFQFRHALLQDAAYSTLLRSTARDLHLRSAETLQVLRPDIADQAPEVLARHLQMGGHQREALRYWVLAADQAIERAAPHETAAHVLSALSCISDVGGDPSLELDLLLKLGAARTATHGYGSTQVQQAYERAASLCVAAPYSSAAFDALIGLTAYFLVSEDLNQAERTATRAVSIGQRRNTLAERVVAASWLGTTKLFLGQLHEAERLLTEALDGYASANTVDRTSRSGLDPGILAGSHLAWLRWMQDEPLVAHRVNEETLALAESLAVPAARAHALIYAAGLAVFQGETEEALRIVATLRELATEARLPHYVAYAEVFGGAARLGSDPEAASEELREGLRHRRETGAHLASTMHHALLAELEIAVGRPHAALIELDHSRHVAATTDERWWAPEIERLRGELHYLSARHAEAQECYARAEELAIDSGALMFARRARLASARVALDFGDTSRAREVLAKLKPIEPSALPESRALAHLLARLDD